MAAPSVGESACAPCSKHSSYAMCRTCGRVTAPGDTTHPVSGMVSVTSLMAAGGCWPAAPPRCSAWGRGHSMLACLPSTASSIHLVE